MKDLTISFSLIVFLFGVCTVSAESVDPHLVHFGDIKLEPCTGDSTCKTHSSVKGTPMVFYGTNHRAPEWRPICRDGYSDKDLASSIAICNMLGYRHSMGQQYQHSFNPQSGHYVSSTDFALSSLDCTNTLSNGAPPNHLLRCKFTPNVTDSHTCSRWGQLHLQCSNPKGYPLTNSKRAYDGQVQLCPPDQLSNDTNPAMQVSMGLVSVLENSYWGSLNSNDSSRSVTRQQADSICRQLGFTGAVLNSARTVSSYSSKYTFSKCQFPIDNSPYGLQKIWLRVSESQYCDKSCPCFSCCYRRPLDGNGYRVGTLSNGQCSKGKCCTENDVVIECTFDMTVSSKPESGSGAVCNFTTTSYTLLSSQVCNQAQENMFTLNQFLAGTLVPTVLLLGILAIFGTYFFHKFRARRDYERIDGNNEPEGNGDGNGNGNRGGNGNGGHGNGNAN